MSDRKQCTKCEKWFEEYEFRGLFDKEQKRCRSCRRRRITKSSAKCWIEYLMRQMKGSDY